MDTHIERIKKADLLLKQKKIDAEILLVKDSQKQILEVAKEQVQEQAEIVLIINKFNYEFNYEFNNIFYIILNDANKKICNTR